MCLPGDQLHCEGGAADAQWRCGMRNGSDEIGTGMEARKMRKYSDTKGIIWMMLLRADAGVARTW
jgi:hypothetical protein